MRRRIVLGFFMSILIASYSLIPAHAASVNLPAKSALESAVAKIKSFADYSKYYGPNSTPITPSEPYYQEYEYLNSLATKTQVLIDKYDDTAFTLRNAEAYNTALPAIDEAIAGCRYLFGIVRAEHLAQQAQTSTSSTATTPASTPTPSVQQSHQTPSASSAPAQSATTSATTQTPSSSSSPLTTFTATDTNDTQQSSATHSDDNTPVEIPKTGGISQSSSILFIVIVSLVAALAATSIYYVYHRPAKHTTPAARRKRR